MSVAQKTDHVVAIKMCNECHEEEQTIEHLDCSALADKREKFLSQEKLEGMGHTTETYCRNRNNFILVEVGEGKRRMSKRYS